MRGSEPSPAPILFTTGKAQKGRVGVRVGICQNNPKPVFYRQGTKERGGGVSEPALLIARPPPGKGIVPWIACWCSNISLGRRIWDRVAKTSSSHAGIGM